MKKTKLKEANVFSPCTNFVCRNDRKVVSGVCNRLLTLPRQCLPGGRNSGQKAQKGPQKKSWPIEFVAEFWLNFTKKWQKRGRRKFSKEVPYF
jgi:hypothetical protein